LGFFEYAAVHWIHHVLECFGQASSLSEVDLERLRSELASFLSIQWIGSPTSDPLDDPRFPLINDSQVIAKVIRLLPKGAVFGLNQPGLLRLSNFLKNYRATF